MGEALFDLLCYVVGLWHGAEWMRYMKRRQARRMERDATQFDGREGGSDVRS